MDMMEEENVVISEEIEEKFVWKRYFFNMNIIAIATLEFVMKEFWLIW